MKDKIWHVGEVYVTDDIIGIWTDGLSTDLIRTEDNRYTLLTYCSEHSQSSRYTLLTLCKFP